MHAFPLIKPIRPKDNELEYIYNYPLVVFFVIYGLFLFFHNVRFIWLYTSF